MKQNVHHLISGVLFSAAFILIDQITKYYASVYLAGTQGYSVIPGVFQLFYLQNRGAAFGMFENCQWIFIVIALAMIGAAGYIYLSLPAGRRYLLARIICILLIAGSVGNMIDRVWHQYVIDFLYFSYIDFPVFNVADIYVCVAVGLTVFALFTVYQDEDFSFFHTKSD